MALTPEWRGRIDHWRNVLRSLMYVKVDDVEFEGFLTPDQLTPEQAVRRKFKPMPAGTPWGAKWEYAWLRATVKLPKSVAGRWVVFGRDCEPAGAESRVIVNRREAGGMDSQHRYLTLAPKAQSGTAYEILIEAYAGHGPMVCGGGPVPHGVESVPEPPDQQQTVWPTSFGIWEEEAYQAWLDLQTLCELRDNLDPESLRVADIDEALREFTLIVDLELPREDMLRTLRNGRNRLRPVLDSVNGPTTPLLYCFGHSHIDVAWLWPLAETERKCARTLSTQLALMEQYPEFKFLQSQPHLYMMTKKRYPELYKRLKDAARRGQLIPEGGMWVEADTNISGGESLIRQFIHGKRFFREEFGVECEMMWLPDVFGYSGALPQIMAGCGIKYFSTQKIFWAYNGGDPFPYNTFWWEGIDGTRVLSHFHNDYNSTTNPTALITRWKERVQKNGLRSRIVPFGHGDGGGGPTRDHLEFLRRQKDLEGAPRTVIASPVEFFKAEEARNATLPTYVGELYFQNHRGTYTSQARTKRGNRFCEVALREAEMWSVAAAALAGRATPMDDLDEAWKKVLLNQFHDIIPGSSIARVYEEAEALHAEVQKTARGIAQDAVEALSDGSVNSVTAFNSLSWDRRALIPLPEDFEGATLDGDELPVQRIGDTLMTEAAVPSCGWLTIESSDPAEEEVASTVKAGATRLENEHLRVVFNPKGEIVNLIDKATGFELAAQPMNVFRLFKDVPRWFDAWDIDSMYELQPVEMGGTAEIEVIANGPLAAAVRIERKLHKSKLVQEVWLRRDSHTLEFRTTIDWKERHKLLKVCFPTALHANEAIHEVQFGHLRRPNHRSRPFDGDRFEVSAHRWTALAEENRGAAVLNDCKYGVNVLGGSINLTLLRAPLAPDMTADLGEQVFTYAFHAWNGSFFESALVREAAELNTPIATALGSAGEKALFRVDAPNILVETVKPAEDGTGDVIVRLYESKHTTTRCTLETTLPVKDVRTATMLEEGGRPVDVRRGAMSLNFRPFEIKTLRMTMRK